MDVGQQVYLRADSFGLMGMAKVRYCQERSGSYVLGLELEKRGRIDAHARRLHRLL